MVLALHPFKVMKKREKTKYVEEKRRKKKEKKKIESEFLY